jgi:hypothetical protein
MGPKNLHEPKKNASKPKENYGQTQVSMIFGCEIQVTSEFSWLNSEFSGKILGIVCCFVA